NVQLTPGSLYTGDVWGLAASVLSLVTNTAATTLIAYKAWSHRQLVRSHLRVGNKRTRVEKVLALLVESGICYCILWVCVRLHWQGHAVAYPAPTDFCGCLPVVLKHTR
ncbi:hypothetical protein C8Q76DRAFT_629595, partial [Earliella scabrosa]